MRILLTADPELPVPPKLYGGIERIVDVLVHNYVAQGHEVTLMAHPESKVPCRLISWQGASSSSLKHTAANMLQLSKHIYGGGYDVLHSFSRLAYLMPVLPLGVKKIMSYQREPTLSQISKAQRLARKGTLHFTGCSNYISNQIKPIASASTVYNCVPTNKYTTTEAVDADAPLVFLGRIEPIKGTHLAVQIAQQSGRRLVIAGNIPLEGKTYFADSIKPFLNERITYIGPVNDQQKNELLGAAAAFLMPIQWNEPFGIVMVEAMACGTPVIGFPLGAVPEVVEHGVNGFICTTVNEAAQLVGQLNSISRKQVRQRTEERFSDAAIADQYLRLYQSMNIQYNTVAAA